MKLIIVFMTACLCTGLYDSAAAKRPNAADGEPPVYKTNSVYGEKIYRQDFEGEPRSVKTWPERTIAERYWLTDGKFEPIPSQSIAVTCNIKDDGQIKPDDCRSDDWKLSRRMDLAKETDAFDLFPTFRKSDYDGKRPLMRTYKFQLALPQFDPPDVDLTTGPLLAKGSFVKALNSLPGRLQYPSRALRREAEGVQTTECQVQVDYSVICKIIAFSPQENVKYFSQSVRSMSRNMKVEKQTLDGTPTRGARFQFNVRWAIPQKGK